MSILGLVALSLQPAQPAASPDSAAGPIDARRETVIAAPLDEASPAPPFPSRIRSRTQDNWVIDSTAAMYLREWAECTVRNKRSISVELMATQLNSPEQAEIIDRLTGRRFARRTVCARFRSMRVDNLVLRGAIAEALRRWEVARRRPAGPLTPPAPPPAASLTASLAQAGYCITERQPEGVQRVMATRLGSRNSVIAIEALRETADACLPNNLRATDLHPILLRGALGEPYFLSRRGQRPGDGAATPAT
jgi:hypothetical protein